MRKTIIIISAIFFAVGLTLPTMILGQAKNDITQDELVRRTQELFDAAGAGDQTP